MRILEASANYRNLRTVLLSGGVGGARMARGLAATVNPAELTVVVNVGDDSTIYGAHVAADLDTVSYTLAGINGPQGWGIAEDTHVVMGHLAAAGIDTTFQLGDRDLAFCLARTAFLDEGGALSDYTREATKRLGIESTILPATDDPVRTKITTVEGQVLDFQDYFVIRRHTDEVAGLEYQGVTRASPAPGVLAAIDAAEVVVIAPSNPPLSIWPTLALPNITAALRDKERVVAVSPLIDGRAIKGPLVSVMQGLGMEPTNAGIVAAYGGLLSHLVIDESDAAEQEKLAQLGVEVIVTDTRIANPDASTRLANEVLDAVGQK
ncbi:MAG: 2-phospho-L-lactate transferase [bacterium]|nr:2-phospho-L-lactate transferase [bacterium]